MSLSENDLSVVLDTITKLEERELTHIEAIIHARKSLMKMSQVAAFAKGDKVKIPDEYGKNVIGLVKRVNRFTVQVDVNGEPHRFQPSEVSKVKKSLAKA